MRRQLLPNGELKPKGKPRGISKKRLEDPSIPDPLKPFHFKPGQTGNPGGRSKATRVSEALTDELSRVHATGVTRAGILASNLIDRAEKDSVELERVIKITEPGLLQEHAGAGSQNVVIGFRYGGKEDSGGKDGAQVEDGKSATANVGTNGHRKPS